MAADSNSNGREWKDFFFQRATINDTPYIAKHIREFFLRDETLNSLIGWCDTKAEEYDRLVQSLIEQGLSFVAKKRGSDKIAGVQLIMDSRVDIFQLHCLTSTSDNFQKLFRIISKLIETTDPIFKTKYNAEYDAQIIMTSVDSEHRSQGLGTEMLTRTLDLLKAKGFPVVRSIFSSPAAQIIGAKLGFEELGRIELKGQVDKDGVELFPSATTEYVADVAKLL